MIGVYVVRLGQSATGGCKEHARVRLRSRGDGWSEWGSEPRDTKQISGELHTLLKCADTEGTYVLVGHSYGGLYARMYAARYPDQVAGVVLVDSSHPEQWARLPGGHKDYQRNNRSFAVAAWAAQLGVIRLFNLIPVPPGPPPHHARRSRHSTPRPDN